MFDLPIEFWLVIFLLVVGVIFGYFYVKRAQARPKKMEPAEATAATEAPRSSEAMARADEPMARAGEREAAPMSSATPVSSPAPPQQQPMQSQDQPPNRPEAQAAPAETASRSDEAPATAWPEADAADSPKADDAETRREESS
jgi:cytoskeletal protein RodZ